MNYSRTLYTLIFDLSSSSFWNITKTLSWCMVLKINKGAQIRRTISAVACQKVVLDQEDVDVDVGSSFPDPLVPVRLLVRCVVLPFVVIVERGP